MRWLILAALLLASPALAEEGEPLTGTLQVIGQRGTIRVGYRETAPPFAFLNPGKQPVGFSLDLCRAIAADVAVALNRDLLPNDAPAWQTGIRIQLVPVAAEARLPMLVDGRIDLECGSTTATAERAKTVAFSPVFFLAGTKLLVPAASTATTLRDLVGRTVVVGAGTTNAAAIRRLAPAGVKIAELADLETAYRMLDAGQADAFASDDILLAGLIATHKSAGRLRVVGEFLSYEPYAIGFRRDDPALAILIRTTFARLAQQGTLVALYNRWLTGRLPGGETLGLPLSAHLAEMYRALGE